MKVSPTVRLALAGFMFVVCAVGVVDAVRQEFGVDKHGINPTVFAHVRDKCAAAWPRVIDAFHQGTPDRDTALPQGDPHATRPPPEKASRVN